MKKLNRMFKISAFLLFVLIVASCKKEVEDPYAYLKTSTENYTVKNIYNNEYNFTEEGEAALIKIWLDSMIVNNMVIDTTSTGLSYIVEKVGVGDNVKTGNKVTVKYIGFFMNGYIFDSSAFQKDETITYNHKIDDLITGWEEGVEVLSKGGRAIFMIPSAKAYGSVGRVDIPPYTPLIFVIEVVDIK